MRTGLGIVEAMAGLVNAEVGETRASNWQYARNCHRPHGCRRHYWRRLAEERTVVGETPNLAARLQGLASPNCVVIGPVTRELVGDVFTYDDLGSHEVRGSVRRCAPGGHRLGR